MTGRERLPNRRASESFTFELNGLRFTETVGRSLMVASASCS
jgi:hypothetical protein